MNTTAERVLFVHAHPYDESISTGGTIATLVDAGASVTVLTCTRGELGEAIDPGAPIESAPAVAQRTRELSQAMSILGVADHRYLGGAGARWPGRQVRQYRDSGMQWLADGRPGYLDVIDPRSLLAADAGEVAADIASVISDVQPLVVVSYDPEGGSGHPDHIRVHEAARRAAEVLGVAFYAIVPGEASRTATVTVDVTGVLDRKRAAIAAHGSQVSVRDEQYALPGGPFHPIGRVEQFRRVRRDKEGTEFSTQSTAGKVGSAALAAVIGAVAGALLTVTHQATALWFGIPVPWGIITAVGITVALLAGLRLVFETRIVPGFAAAGLLAAVALLSLQGAGGSVLVPANTAGYTWTFAPTLIALVVLAWPRLGRRR